MEKLIELVGKLYTKHGKLGLFVVVVAFLIVWGVIHYNAPSRSQVSILGIFNYQKSPDDEAIKSRRDLNIRLLHIYFSEKKDIIHRFVNEWWTPKFAQEFYTRPGVSKYWDQIVKEKDKKSRQLFIQKTGPTLQRKINEKTLELVKPLEELEWRLTTGIREERLDIDKIVAKSIDEVETLLSRLFSGSGNGGVQFKDNMITLYKSLEPEVDGFKPNLSVPLK